MQKKQLSRSKKKKSTFFVEKTPKYQKRKKNGKFNLFSVKYLGTIVINNINHKIICVGIGAGSKLIPANTATQFTHLKYSQKAPRTVEYV